MKFETVLFAVAFACLGLISIPKEKSGEDAKAASPAITEPAEDGNAIRLSQAGE